MYKNTLRLPQRFLRRTLRKVIEFFRNQELYFLGRKEFVRNRSCGVGKGS